MLPAAAGVDERQAQHVPHRWAAAPSLWDAVILQWIAHLIGGGVMRGSDRRFLPMLVEMGCLFRLCQTGTLLGGGVCSAGWKWLLGDQLPLRAVVIGVVVLHVVAAVMHSGR